MRAKRQKVEKSGKVHSGETTVRRFRGAVLSAPAREVLKILVLIALGVVAYSNTLENPFTFDDVGSIKQNQHIRLTSLSLEGIVKAALKSPSSSRPVANISFAVNYYFHQYHLMGYHVVNIVVHIAAGILLYLFIKATLRMPLVRSVYQQYPWIPFFAACIWVVHPLHTQSVTYIVQRMNSMAAMFFLLSFLLYVKGRSGSGGIGGIAIQDLKLQTQNLKRATHGSRSKVQNPKSKIRTCYLWFGGSVIAWLLAMGSKQIATTLPFFVLLYEWYFLQDMSKQWLKSQAKYVVGGGVLLGMLVFVYLGMNPWETITGKYTDLEYSFGERVLTEFRVVVYYLSLLVHPHPSRLNLDYDYRVSHSLVDPLSTIVSICGVMGLIGYGMYVGRRERLVSFCILWFFGNLVIESLIPKGLIYEHRTYLPSMLVILLVVMIGFRCVRPKTLVVLILCLVGGIYFFWTYERNKVWSSNSRLWGDCVAKSPQKARPHNNLGIALDRRGDHEEGIEHFTEALRIQPDYAEVHYNLAVALANQDNLDEAIPHFTEALRIKPDYLEAHYNLGVALATKENLEGAILHLSEALLINPDHAEAHNNLGRALMSQGNLKKAIPHFTEAVRLNPDYAEAHNNLGVAFNRQGDREQAIEHFTEAVRIESEYAEAHYNLGFALSNEGKIKEAIRHLLKAVAIEPDNAKAHHDLGIALARNGEFIQAIHHFSEALRIDPTDSEAHYNLGVSLLRQGKLDEAIDQYSEALRLNPEHAEAQYNLANALVRQGKLQEAMTRYAEVLRLKPTFVEAHVNLAAVYLSQRNFQKAMSHCFEALEINPDFPEAHYYLGVALIGLDKLEEASHHFSEVLRIEPKHREARKMQKALLQKAGKSKEAR